MLFCELLRTSLLAGHGITVLQHIHKYSYLGKFLRKMHSHILSLELFTKVKN